MRISDWSSDVCSSDLHLARHGRRQHLDGGERQRLRCRLRAGEHVALVYRDGIAVQRAEARLSDGLEPNPACHAPSLVHCPAFLCPPEARSEEHTSELQSLMRISYAVFCLQKRTYT